MTNLEAQLTFQSQFNVKFLIDYLDTHNFQEWNARCNQFQGEQGDSDICHFLSRIMDIDSNKPTEVVTVYQENGHQYKGRLWNGRKHDANAEYHYDDYLYNGPFVGDLRHGEGATVQTVGDCSIKYVFEGSFKKDKRHGEGHLIIQNTRSGGKEERYSGTFFGDMYHGSGVHVNKQGDVYEGEFVKGRRHGVGKLKTSRENYSLEYIGDFQNDQFEGTG